METKKIYLLYRGDAWLSSASLTLIAPFTTFEKAVDYLHKKSREYGIDRDAVAQFKSIRQTQGLEENFYCEELEVDPEPEVDEFYDRIFKYGQSELSRGELESLPVPFRTKNVTDEQMEEIVRQTELDTRDRLRLNEGEPIDFENDRHSEVWWEEMEAAVCRHNVPYHEDIDEE
ncbi:hypothetical protein [Alistipes senegalensis]|uniref:hypothetical protein n=1 Tax=Alistipes senegalensis TaxID=1288121 RepID=UPI00266F863F|nr:hypothetical protein [Alistipes senegalensis]